jgi:two-component system sensor histidine kinase UhpB
MKISSSLKLALAFLLFGVTWIMVTDFVSEDLAEGNSLLFKNLQHFKGILFIIIAALLMYFLSKRLNDHIDKANKKKEDALKRYNVLGMATNDAIWDLNLKTNECYTNRTLQELFGYTQDELWDNHSWWENNLHPDDKDRVIAIMDSKLESGGTVWQDEYRFRCKDGSYKQVFDRGFIMRDKHGNPYRLIGAMQDVTAQRALQEQLTTQKLRYKTQLAQGVIRAQESERKKLGEELHDNINQLLGVVKLYLDHAQVDATMKDELIKKSSNYLMQVIEEIRNISKSLMPPTLKDIGLFDSIQELIHSITSTGNLEIRLHTDGLEENELSDEIQLLIYRILQEQFNNILRHAKAKKVEVKLTCSNNKVSIQITDDGKGADPAVKSTGIGLQNIKSRLEVYNGTMKIETGPGTGYKLEVEFELGQTMH